MKTGKLSAEDGKFYSGLFELRQTGDYDDWHEVTSADILPLMPTAESFLNAVEELIHKERLNTENKNVADNP